MATTAPQRIEGQQALVQQGEPADRTLEEIECDFLADWMERNGNKRPNVTKAWTDAARRLREIDGRSHDQIMACIEWCQRNEFWQGNIHSMTKLRMQYDKLRSHAIREQRNPRGAQAAAAKKDKQRELMERLKAAEAAA